MPAPSMAAGMSVALIAGERSAPRNTLRVMTVILGPLFASATAGIAMAATASATTGSADQARRGF